MLKPGNRASLLRQSGPLHDWAFASPSVLWQMMPRASSDTPFLRCLFLCFLAARPWLRDGREHVSGRAKRTRGANCLSSRTRAWLRKCEVRPAGEVSLRWREPLFFPRELSRPASRLVLTAIWSTPPLKTSRAPQR